MNKASPSRGTPPPDAQTLLLAADAGDVAEVESLLAAGADVNAASDGGETALMRAASKGHLEVVRLLLDAGADLEARSENGFTALVVAVFFGHAEVVRALLARGASPDAWTRLGATAERWAESSGRADIVELLESSGDASVESLSTGGRTTTSIKADATEFFQSGDASPVVPLAEVNDATPAEAGANVAEMSEVVSVEVEAAKPEEHEEPTLVPARSKHKIPFQPHASARWNAPPPRLFAAVALGLILGAVAGVFAVWQNSRRSSPPARPAVQTALPQPTDSAQADTSADIGEPQPTPTIPEPEATEPNLTKVDVAETVAPPPKPVAPARPQPAAAPRPRDTANAAPRHKRAPAPAPRREVAAEESGPRTARAARRAPNAEAQAQVSKPSESSVPVSTPKPAASGERKVIPWP